jgi:Uma2 family endonuclease
MDPVTVLQHGRPFTRADLDAMPDDGRRYELVDGVLIVSPSPTPLHQRAAFRLAMLLNSACPPELEVLMARLDVVLADDTVLEPDVLVGRRADFTEKNLPAPPVLAVEVLSPSTRRFDLMLKRSRFETARTKSYWVIDPLEPSLRAWDLQGGRYVEVAHVQAGTEWTSVRPYPVTIGPAGLVSQY